MIKDPQKLDPHLPSVEAKILRERDEILALRSELMRQRQELLARLRFTDRRLADCRAAARFFGLKIDFPEEEPEVDRIDRARLEKERIVRRPEGDFVRMANGFLRPISPPTTQPGLPQSMSALVSAAKTESPPSQHPDHANAVAAQPSQPPAGSAAVETISNAPKIRDVVLERLEAAGGTGSKAAAIREFYERVVGRSIHEKTVGMTLYRLQNEGIVRREGHIWFFVPPEARTENPGVSAPGHLNSER